jgi:hypothetical protein
MILRPLLFFRIAKDRLNVFLFLPIFRADRSISALSSPKQQTAN